MSEAGAGGSRRPGHCPHSVTPRRSGDTVARGRARTSRSWVSPWPRGLRSIFCGTSATCPPVPRLFLQKVLPRAEVGPGDGEERGGQIRVALAQGDEVWAIGNPSRPSAEDVSCWASRRGRAGGQSSSGKDPSTIEIHRLQTGASGCGSSSLPAPGTGSQLLALLLRINPIPWSALGFQPQLAKPQQRGARCWWPPREPGAAVEKGKAASCVELVHDKQALPSSPEHR